MNIDAAIVQRARRGELEAFRLLVEAVKHDLYRIILTYTRNHHDAEDVLQETFLRAYRGLSGFRGDSQLTSWLTRIAINACLDQQRKNRIVALPLPDGDGESGNEPREEDPQRDPGRYTESRSIQRQIDNAIAQLTPFERAVFVLRHQGGYTTKETAHALGKAEGTIKNITFRALHKLRKRLSRHIRTTEAVP